MDTSERQRRVVEEAAEWWLILQGEASRQQRERYVDWLRESSAHVAEMLHVAQVHGALEQFQRWSALSIEASRAGEDNVVRLAGDSGYRDAPQFRSKVTRLRRVALATAATILIAAVVMAVLQLRPNEVRIHTERGERREVALSDGSVVQVDPETSLRVGYEEHVRRVVLESGRALFHVAKNSERPFLVQANQTTVRAVGTAFAVEKSENQSLLVTVAEGTVAVFGHSPANDASNSMLPLAPNNDSASARGGKPAMSSSPVGPSNAQLLVTAGEQVSVAREGVTQSVHSVDSSRALAWADGRLIFDNSSVADAVLQFNRYNRIQIIVNDRTLDRRLINGTFDAADPESFAAFMQSVARVRISRDERADITLDAVK